MSEQSEVPTRFVRTNKDGSTVEHEFIPVDVSQDGSGVMMVAVVQVGDAPQGGRPLRHLSFDDPPFFFGTEEAYRDALAEASRVMGEEEFVERMVHALGRDLTESHGCDPQVAIPAIREFARKVWNEYHFTV